MVYIYYDFSIGVEKYNDAKDILSSPSVDCSLSTIKFNV